jgi:hypothetical protein
MFANIIDLRGLAGEKCFASGCLRQPFKYSRIGVRVALREHANRIDDGARLLRHSRDASQCMRAGIVAAIADQHQHFVVPAAQLKLFESGGDRIVKSSLAISGRSGDRGFEIGRVVGEPAPPTRPENTRSLKFRTNIPRNHAIFSRNPASFAASQLLSRRARS